MFDYQHHHPSHELRGMEAADLARDAFALTKGVALTLGMMASADGVEPEQLQALAAVLLPLSDRLEGLANYLEERDLP